MTMVLAVDPGLEVTALALFADVPPARLGTPMMHYMASYRWAESLRSKPADGEDEARMGLLADALIAEVRAYAPVEVVIEIPARDNVYAQTAKRQRVKGSTMNLAEVMRNVRLGGVLAGAVMTVPQAGVQFHRADGVRKDLRTAALGLAQYPEGTLPPANEHERDAVWLGLRWLADRALLERTP